jgi:hypothetical protein
MLPISFIKFTLITFVLSAFFLSIGCAVAKDTQLQVKIKDMLKADRNVQYDKLIVNVMKGVVTISGKLNTQEEIDHVVEVVKAIPGVVEVKNQMSLPDNYNSNNPTFLDPFN